MKREGCGLGFACLAGALEEVKREELHYCHAALLDLVGVKDWMLFKLEVEDFRNLRWCCGTKAVNL